jgi:transporter family-2 protein
MGWLYLVAAVIGGVLIGIQGPINAQLRTWVGDPVRAAFVSITVSFVSISLALLATSLTARRSWPTASHLGDSPWWVWTGGLMGAVYVAAATVLVPRLGAAVLLALVLVGQMVISVILDHFGLLGLPSHPLSVGRVAGGLLLIAGVVLIRRA